MLGVKMRRLVFLIASIGFEHSFNRRPGDQEKEYFLMTEGQLARIRLEEARRFS
jgi:hypothetical protein